MTDQNDQDSKRFRIVSARLALIVNGALIASMCWVYYGYTRGVGGDMPFQLLLIPVEMIFLIAGLLGRYLAIYISSRSLRDIDRATAKGNLCSASFAFCGFAIFIWMCFG